MRRRPHLLTLAFLTLPLAAQTPGNAGPTTLSSTPGQTPASQNNPTPAGATVSVPLADGDNLNVTGPLALRHRGSKQFFVIESPTPYRIASPLGADGPSAKPHIVRDIAFTLPGQQQDLTVYIGQTITASGRAHLQPTPTTWNGVVLQSKVVILPGGHELRSKK